MRGVGMLPVIGGSLNGGYVFYAATDSPLVKRLGGQIEIYYPDEVYHGHSVVTVLRHYATLPIGGVRR